MHEPSLFNIDNMQDDFTCTLDRASSNLSHLSHVQTFFAKYIVLLQYLMPTAYNLIIHAFKVYRKF